MRNLIVLAVILGVIGLIVGYLIFARAPVSGDLIEVKTLISPPDGLVGRVVEKVGNLAEIRRNILLCSAGGIVLGVGLSVVLGKR